MCQRQGLQENRREFARMAERVSGWTRVHIRWKRGMEGALSRNGKIRMENWLAFRERNYRDSVHVHQGGERKKGRWRAQRTCTGNVFGERGSRAARARSRRVSIDCDRIHAADTPAESFRRGLLPPRFIFTSHSCPIASTIYYDASRAPAFLNYPTRPPPSPSYFCVRCVATLRLQTSIPSVSWRSVSVEHSWNERSIVDSRSEWHDDDEKLSTISANITWSKSWDQKGSCNDSLGFISKRKASTFCGFVLLEDDFTSSKAGREMRVTFSLEKCENSNV